MELAVIRAIQSAACPALDILFQALTLFGEPYILILLFCSLYWAADKQRGERLGFALAVSLPLCSILKEFFHFSRPIGQPGVRSLRTKTAGGYSFPSGHTQNAAAAYGSLMLAETGRPFKKAALLRRGRRGYFLLMLLVGLSRLYLGVHYPKDVLAGLCLGLLCAWWTHTLFLRTANRPLLYLCCAAALLPFLFFFSGQELYACEGCLLGFALAALFERAFVGFSTDVPVETRLIRLACGLVLLGGLGRGLQQLLPGEGPAVLLRYALLVFSGMGLYPWLFTACEREIWKKKHYSPTQKRKG